MSRQLLLNSPQGADAVFAQANQGSARAMRMAAVLNAGGIQCERNWQSALDWLTAAAQRGDSDAQGELVGMCHDTAVIDQMTALARRDLSFPTDIWMQLRDGVDLEKLLSAPTDTYGLNDTPLVLALTDLASSHLCAWLRGRAAVHLKPSAGYFEMEFNLGNTGLPLLALRERVSRFLETPHLLPTTLRRYARREHEALHFERRLPPSNEPDVGLSVASLRLFLNEDYLGGHVEFPHLGIAYRGKLGHALIWADTQKDGRADPLCESAVQEIQQGEQWVLAQRARGPHDDD
ncbi:MAG: hypothetical protein JWM33_1575 [Caulobacteraceae bacterium]|nr:hypothetical protein [Caulobacteraceae bacterium]